MNNFRHVTAVEVRFVDIDAFGHVNNAHYLTFAEQARFQYFEEILAEKINWKTEGLILASSKIDYVNPVLLQDKIKVYTRCSRFGNKSLDFEYQLYNEKKIPELKAKMYTTLVAYNYISGISIAIPEEWKKIILAYEGNIPNG